MRMMFFIAAVLIAQYSNSLGSGGTLTVGPGCDYTSIQEAITQANSGDSIHIVQGVYTENIDLTNIDIDYEITGGFNTCQDAENGIRTAGNRSTIDGGLQPLMIINDNNSSSVVWLTGLDMTNGYEGGFSPTGGIFVQGTVSLVITDSSVSNNTSISGGGLYLEEGTTALLRDTIVSNNSALNPTGGYGGGIFCNGCLLGIVGASGVSNNMALNDGGGIYLDSGSILQMFSGYSNSDNNSQGVNHNQSGGNGGGIFALESQVNLVGYPFKWFGASNGYLNNTEPASITYNHANYEGGGIFAQETNIFAAAIDISYNSVDNQNDVEAGGGGGVKLISSSTFNIDYTTEYSGCWQTDVTKCNQLIGNQASTDVDHNSDHYGGAINMLHSSLMATHVWFESNDGVAIQSSSATNVSTIFSRLGGISIDNSVFFNNGQTSAGRNLAVVSNSGGGTLISHTTFASNNLTTDGHEQKASVQVFGDINPAPFVEVNNNVFYDFSGMTPVRPLYVAIDSFKNAEIDCLLVSQSEGLEAEYGATNVIESDPLFVDSLTGDLALTQGSPAVDQCQSVFNGAEDTDMASNPRNNDVPGIGNDNSNYSDMGAIEYMGDLIFKDGFELLL